MGLDKYWEKRDFQITPEPRGKMVQPGKQLHYYIQKHHARRLHYDFRLELEGTLKSWAVPKGPSLDPEDKRLAVHVEDHPLEYGTFEGEIPAHQYGAGHVLLWDRGIWTPIGDPNAGYRKGRLKFQLDGEKLAGSWSLVRMSPREGEKQENWLLIKEHDEEARSGDAAQITELRPESVADKPAAAKKSNRSGGKSKQAKRKSNAEMPATPQAKPASPMPVEISPQLATLASHAPEGDEWVSEIKFDGYRALCRVDNDKARIYTRGGLDWSSKWPDIAKAAAALPVEQAWLDGEVVAIEPDGSISFQALQNMARHGKAAQLAYYVFDLLYLNGADLREVPLIERKQLLKTLLDQSKESHLLLYSEHIAGGAREVFEHACMHGLEGIVVKRADSTYLSARSRSWLKVKCMLRQEFVVAGYTEPAGSREQFGALLIGVYDDNQKLRYCGRVGTGFDAALLKSVSRDFNRLEQAKPAFANPPKGSEARGVHWLNPELVAEVSFAQWTHSGVVRHASFVGLRNDKPANEIQREKALSDSEIDQVEAEAHTAAESVAKPAKKVSTRAAAKQTAAASGKNARGNVAGIEISNPAKILFADAGLTKLGLAQYYERIAEWVLPHLQQRPLTLVRCPNGGGAKCFFQKHVNETVSEEIERIEVPEGDGGSATYMMANNEQALVGLVQMGVLELHTWGSHEGALTTPDRIIFDLDPAEGLDWQLVIEAAQLVRGLLDEIGLQSFVKTTGGKGLHVVAPIKPEHQWDEIKAFSKAIAEHLARTLPDRFTANMAKAKRVDRIFIDYLRNGSGATAVAAYSTRAKPDAAVSVPISWEELKPALHSNSFNVGNILDRMEQLKQDPWRDYFRLKQRITAKMLGLF
jgi:bifunctional non-homologous end joining protein LigD